MNVTDEQKKWIAWIIVTAVTVAVSIFLGVTYPIPEPPLFGDEAIALGETHFTSLSVGDASETDTYLKLDGNARDFYLCLDDSADDLVFGYGSTCGTTAAFAVDEDQVTTWTGGTIALAETTTAIDTLTAAECGKTIFLNSATEFSTTLPAVSTVAAGCEFRFVVKAAPSGADYTVITGNSDEDVLIGGINELETDTGDDGPYDASADTITFVDGTAVVGDMVYMVSDGTYFYVRGQAQADGGVTITDSD
jgi:hypothetical protein